MDTVLYIAGFGALGCLARFYLSGWVYGLLGRGFPYGTFAVNIVGAFIIGLIMEFGMRSTVLPANLRTGLTIGFLGGSPPFPPSAMKRSGFSKMGNSLSHQPTSCSVFLPVFSSPGLA
jgi:fluoride ion exporter CrcB/FEX